ncbi:hypothetical protein E1283_30510 [Streptomyces hainanensis]|uniref:Serine/threonine protein kinase n=1 Tax=Streptomyces hainanensis TaxID=402648 RepID=A0A4R4STV1_9ACTN|nr:hypothetical protein E1283_30510 [Streptomyces hainanensis]
MATMTSAVPPPGFNQPPGQQPPGAPPYGYPQQAAPGYGYPQQHDMGGPQGPYGTGYPVGPGGPGKRNNNTVWIVVAAIVAVALAAGIAIFAVGSGDDDNNNQADGNSDGGGGNGGNNSTEDDQSQPTTEPTREGSESDSTAPDPNATVPPGYAGAWVGEVTGDDGAFMLRLEIEDGTAGQAVVTEYSLLDSVMCVEGSTLVSSNNGMQVTGSGVTSTFPTGATCNPFGEQTITMQGTTLHWESGRWSADLSPSQQDVGSDGMPYAIFTETFSSSDLRFDPETTSYPGDLALTVTNADNSCSWSQPMMNGGLQETTIYVGPGSVLSGDCDALPSYRISWPETNGGKPSQIQFFRLGSDSAEFTAQNDNG